MKQYKKLKNNYKSKSFLHKKIGKIVEGQITDCFNKHPDYFDLKSHSMEIIKQSLAKRITGEVIQYMKLLTPK